MHRVTQYGPININPTSDFDEKTLIICQHIEDGLQIPDEYLCNIAIIWFDIQNEKLKERNFYAQLQFKPEDFHDIIQQTTLMCKKHYEDDTILKELSNMFDLIWYHLPDNVLKT